MKVVNRYILHLKIHNIILILCTLHILCGNFSELQNSLHLRTYNKMKPFKAFDAIPFELQHRLLDSKIFRALHSSEHLLD